MTDYVRKAKLVPRDHMGRGRTAKVRMDPGLVDLALAYLNGEVTYSQVNDTLVTFGIFKHGGPSAIMALTNELRAAIRRGEVTAPARKA